MRPRWSDLTDDQKATFGNGVGPDWFPSWLTKVVTERVCWFFDEASWRHHDFGYAIGYSIAHKFEYDWKFARAMIRDAKKEQLRLAAYGISLTMYLAVTLFGWASFNWGSEYTNPFQ